MGRKPPKAWPAARRSASTSARPRSAGPSRPCSQSTTARFQRTKERAASHPRPVRPGPAGRSRRRGRRTAQPRERARQERDPRGNIGQHAIALWPSEGRLIRLVAADRIGALGVIEQRLGAQLEALGGAVRLDHQRPVADPVRQRRKPGRQGRALAAAEQRLDVPLDQPRRPGSVPRGQRVPHHVIGQIMLVAPGGRGPVQRCHPAGLLGLQPGAQQIGEQLVVAPRAAVDQQHGTGPPARCPAASPGCGPAGDRITQLPRQPLQHRRLPQETAHRPGLAVKDLISQVVQHEAVAAAERCHEPGRIRVPLQRQREPVAAPPPTPRCGPPAPSPPCRAGPAPPPRLAAPPPPRR